MMRSVRSLSRNTDGAVAATVGLSLFALIAVGGIAFDYARLASLDSELQDAADQAALAAASQLDQTSGSMQRAQAAAASLLTNRTYMANDANASGTSVTIPTVMFYKLKADAESDSNGFTDTTKFADAHFVRVAVAPRQAVYALTPVVAAFRSGNIGAEAVAGLGQSICKTPPVMICNPEETAGNTNFNPSTYVGKGLKLVSVGNGSGAWVPGNFGYLDNAGGSSGANGLKELLGWSALPGDCLEGSGVDTKPGASVSVTDAIDTRFDIYDSNQACQSGGACPASINSVKDLLRNANASGGNSCKMHSQGWGEAASGYYDQAISATVPLPTTTTPAAMGHPRDMCHAVSINGSCTGGQIGDGVWDRDAYFRTNYLRSDGTRWTSAQWQTNTGLSPTVAATAANYASRYNVYNWEIAHRDQVIDGVTILGPNPAGASGNTKVAYGKPVCSPTEGYGPGSVPGGATPDRRRISAAVVNCIANDVHGNSTGLPVAKWIELFLVEPSLNRNSGKTNAGDVYVEVISETQAGAGATAGQVVRRDVPYLIK
jgi:Flp pilus assembly protein TadG